ncbi:MAG: geranylgeranylglyceryl/heptaprenylglyceryl phosphate synthase [Candidatus Zixiibacteriota bacterium]
MPLFEQLMQVRENKGAGFFLLLDPDRVDTKRLKDVSLASQSYGVDAILAGSSMVTATNFDARMAEIKRSTELPVLLFPGNSGQVSKHADGILFLSLISGRNATFLIEEQVKGAPLIKAFGLEPIPTGYMLIESGKLTSVQFVSGTLPIPREKTDIAMAHALAARYLGMKTVYLEAGSGAKQTVPEEMITAVAEYCELPVIVGGGINTPDDAARIVRAGASFVVIGTRLEFESDFGFMSEMADAIHSSARTVI